MVPIRQNLLSASKYNLKVPVESCAKDMKYIVIHNTANDASAANEIAYMIGNNSSTSFNVAVDDKEIVIGIPLNRGAFAAGTRDGNAHGVHIEICYSKSGGARFDKAEKNAAEYAAKLLKERRWDISHLKKHQDFDGKYCPHRTLDRGWQRFVNMVKTYMGTSKPAAKPAALKPASSTFKPYLIRKNCRDPLNIRKGPGTNYGVQGQIKDTLRYTIVEERSGPGSAKGWCRLKAGGWVAKDWVKKA